MTIYVPPGAAQGAPPDLPVPGPSPKHCRSQMGPNRRGRLPERTGRKGLGPGTPSPDHNERTPGHGAHHPAPHPEPLSRVGGERRHLAQTPPRAANPRLHAPQTHGLGGTLTVPPKSPGYHVNTRQPTTNDSRTGRDDAQPPHAGPTPTQGRTQSPSRYQPLARRLPLPLVSRQPPAKRGQKGQRGPNYRP